MVEMNVEYGLGRWLDRVDGDIALLYTVSRLASCVPCRPYLALWMVLLVNSCRLSD